MGRKGEGVGEIKGQEKEEREEGISRGVWVGIVTYDHRLTSEVA